jgi:hypothetical protein
MRLYLEQKGRVLCSTCKDKLEADPGCGGPEPQPER